MWRGVDNPLLVVLYVLAAISWLPSRPAAAGELTLAEALEIASGGNRGLAMARSQVAEQEAALRGALAERWPSLDFSQRVTRIDGSTVARANSAADGLSQLIGFDIPPFVFQDSFRTQLDLAVPVWTSGGLSSSIGAERDGLDASRADEQAVLRSTRGEVARAFFAAVANGEVTVARKKALERAERRLQEAARRLEVGLTTRQEVLRWQVEVESARAAVAVAEADTFVARLELRDVLDSPHGELGEPVPPANETVEALLAWAESLDFGVVMARAEDELGDLPEVRAAEARLARRGAEVQRSHSSRLPRLDAAASYGWLENETFELDEFENWSATLLLTIPLDLRGRLKADVARSRARRTAAAVAVEDARAARRLELGRALADVVRARSRLRSAGRAADEASARRELLRRETEVGVSGLLDFIDADTTLVDAEVTRATARVDLLAAIAALELVWPGADPPAGGLIP